jgi:hypothetical protein
VCQVDRLDRLDQVDRLECLLRKLRGWYARRLKIRRPHDRIDQSFDFVRGIDFLDLFGHTGGIGFLGCRDDQVTEFVVAHPLAELPIVAVTIRNVREHFFDRWFLDFVFNDTPSKPPQGQPARGDFARFQTRSFKISRIQHAQRQCRQQRRFDNGFDEIADLVRFKLTGPQGIERPPEFDMDFLFFLFRQIRGIERTGNGNRIRERGGPSSPILRDHISEDRDDNHHQQQHDKAAFEATAGAAASAFLAAVVFLGLDFEFMTFHNNLTTRPGVASPGSNTTSAQKNPVTPIIPCDRVSLKVEDNGIEPMTFWLPARRSPS